ncbi:hypothetical protein ABT354_20480 [Streptomyces sp. NPDC000594]|uniref:hypothetical protein n=1 Tax=Streptomyces sp. NPDC000594 TaxID=3154261 RepID=UPI00331F1320
MWAISRIDVQGWIRALIEKGTGASAIQRSCNLMSSITRAAVDDDIIAVSPCRSIDRRRSRLFVVEVNTKSGLKEYPKSSKSRREVPLPPHVLDALERHIRHLERDAVVFTTITKGRAGRLLDDGNWRTQTWWPAADNAYCFDADADGD